MLAAVSVSKGDNRFARRYRELNDSKGLSIAQPTVSRSTLATVYAMWKTGELYRED